MLATVDLSGAHSKEDVVTLLQARSRQLPAGSWVFGNRLDNNKWPEQTIPTRDDLDVIPNPVVLQRVCLHVSVANSLAIAAVGESSFDGVSGAVRDSCGRLTGVFEERSAEPFYAGPTCDSAADFRATMQKCLSFGLAELHTIGIGSSAMSESLEWYRGLRDRGELSLRIRLFLDSFPESTDANDDWVSYAGFKALVDGSLGGRTAAMRRPFLDVGRTGVLTMSDDELADLVRRVNERGVQLMIHCIGDRALDQLLDALERAPVKNQKPYKLTHVQVCHPEQIARIAALGAFCDVQPTMVTSDGSFLMRILDPETFRCCSPFRSMINAGIVLVGGSDAPVEVFNPIEGIQVAVVRAPELNLDETIPLEEALKMYTINAQKLIMNDANKGLLQPGFVADIAVFEENLFEVPPEQLAKCTVATTIVAGKVAYSKPPAD
jgi:predicted amidohydrolase YtcJ